MKIVLIGYMGSGKSAVGKHLASILKIDFKDLDNEIEADEKQSIAQIFSKKSEIYFRKREKETLKTVIDTKNDFVLATGGGTPCYGDTMDLLLKDKEILIIYLRTPIPVLTERIFPKKSKRPLIAHIETKEDLNEFISKHIFERSQFYNRASLTFNIENKTISEIVAEIILELI